MSGSDTLADQAYRVLEHMIVTNELRAGTMISETALRSQLGLGRTPVREALQRLKLEGYVEIHPSRGARVTEVEVMRQLWLLEVRRPLEELMVRKAATRASRRERDALSTLAENVVKAAASGEPKAFLESTKAIQQSLASAAGNPELAKTIGVTHGLSRRFWYSHIEDSGTFDEAAALYSATLAAVVNGAADEAAAAAGRFLDFLERLTRSAIEPA